MRYHSIVTLTLCTIAFLATVAADVEIGRVTTIDQVPASGDQYPAFLPVVDPSDPTPFRGKKAIFMLSHGAEDHEVYYQHQYFTSRGATVEFLCVNERTVLSDFVKPTYVVDCTTIDSVDDWYLTKYDIVFIPGGIPSSSNLRFRTPAMRLLTNFYFDLQERGEDPKSKLLAVICSGVETLIESMILGNLEGPVTGSPASQWSIKAALSFLGRPESDFQGLNPDVLSIYRRATTERPALILGKDPTASPNFTASIGSMWAGVNEFVPEPITSGEPLHMDSGVYKDSQFLHVESLDELPSEYADQDVPAGKFARGFTDKQGNPRQVGVFVGPGTDASGLAGIPAVVKASGGNATYYCPSWVPQYKDGVILGLSDPPIVPMFLARCDRGFDHPSVEDLDVIIVAPGLFSNGGVLRNDGSVAEILTKARAAGKVVVLVGTAELELVPLRLTAKLTSEWIDIKQAPLVRETERDLGNVNISSAMVFKPYILNGGFASVGYMVTFADSMSQILMRNPQEE